ncbi:hypothetical protein IJ541_05110 [bacterium]|nr:hypothetical protein [bacterium]
MLIRRLSNIGNSWGIIIPKALLEILNVNPVRDELILEIEPDGIKIKKHIKEK